MHFVGSPFRSASDACLKSIRQIKFYLFTVQGKKILVDVSLDLVFGLRSVLKK